MEYKVGTLVFNGDWEITRRIGSGASGIVYEIKSTQFSSENTSAMKVIQIPQSEEEKQQVLNEGMDKNSLTNYFASIMQEIVNEVSVMMNLDGHPNIVSLKQYMAVPHEDGIGWDILIRMELLTTLDKYFSERLANEEQVIQVGLDVSAALSYMSENNIVHRDIKPENIFIDRFNHFKVGDFGAARVVEHSIGMSKKGTELYMAPEVYRGEKYSKSVDVYSLGIVLYKLANKNRLPFYPPAPSPITWSDRENALLDRVNGKAMPAPSEASAGLAEVILKACAFKSECRYRNAMEMNNALNALRGNRGAQGAFPAARATQASRSKSSTETREKSELKGKKQSHESVTDNTSESRNKQRVVPDNAPSQVPNSEYSVRQAYQRKPESDSTSQYEISSKSRRENEAFSSAEELLLKYRHSMERYSERVDENKKKLSLALSRKKYEETVDSLKALKYVYEKMIDNTEQAISRMKKAGLPDSNKQMIELNETYKDLQREYGSVERQLSTLPKPKPVGKLIALMAVIVIGIIIAIMAITYSSNSGVTITITNGSVIANGGN